MHAAPSRRIVPVNRRKPWTEGRAGIDPVMAEATRWFVTLHEEPSDRNLQPAFEAWRAADSRHAAAYERLQRLWGASGHLPSLIPSAPSMDRRALLRNVAGAGATVAVVTGAGRLVLGAHPFADHRTQAGERSTVILTDGSRIELSTATALAVDLTSQRRRIRLLEGEAWFQVEPDASRPFVVEAAGGSTTALGTAFAVALTGRNVDVAVTEHAVRVAGEGAQAHVAEGQSLSYGPRGLGVVQAANPLALAWREGRLAFVDRPLGEVAAALDRWTGGRTVVLDAALASRRVTLTLGTEDAREGLDRLADVTPMRITRLTSALTVIGVF